MIVPEAPAQVHSDGAVGGTSPEGLSAESGGGPQTLFQTLESLARGHQGHRQCLSQSDGRVGVPTRQGPHLSGVPPTGYVGMVSDTVLAFLLVDILRKC